MDTIDDVATDVKAATATGANDIYGVDVDNDGRCGR